MQNNELIFMPGSCCPVCRSEHSPVLIQPSGDGIGPRPGDFTICRACGEPLILDEQLYRMAMNAQQRASFYLQFPQIAQRLAQYKLAGAQGWAEA